MVFSFFKKEPKDAKVRAAKTGGGVRTTTPPTGNRPPPLGKPLPDPSNRATRAPSQRFATTENAIPDRDLHRSLAMETAAKIDQIESEMARDFLRPPGSPAPSSSLASRSEQPAAKAEDKGATRTDDNNTEEFFGSVDAIEISTSGAGSIVDETAILFANGQDGAAEQVLRAGIAADDLGATTQNAWMMLFELLNQRNDRAGFEQLTMQYALRFENSAPSWIQYDAPPSRTVGPVVAIGSPTVRLPATVDANVVQVLEQLKTLAASHAALTLDVSGVKSIDLVGAELLLRVLNAFKRSAHELTVVGTERLMNPLRAIVEAGRRDASDAGWMLQLEVLRLLNRQNDFEETGIQYCITFEVSPPQWEPAPPNLKAQGAVASAAGPAIASTEDPLTWRGVIEGEGEPWFGRLVSEARKSKHLIVECTQLRRMAFSAASALLTVVMKLQQSGARVEFRGVNPLVGSLFQLLGVTAVAAVALRRP
ncbi:MAG TPA: STAS domain-containing protein [Burkholderiaceae bacterium]|nr:STAS domain-containing protein [Burkholderiaceae bacterium]